MIFEKKRSESDIIYELLSATLPGIKKTRLMYKTNMSNTQLTRYLETLIEKDIICVTPTNPEGNIYYVTEKGKEILNQLSTLKDALQ